MLGCFNSLLRGWWHFSASSLESPKTFYLFWQEGFFLPPFRPEQTDEADPQKSSKKSYSSESYVRSLNITEKDIMGFLGIFWKWFFYHTEVLHLFSRQTEDIMQILNVWNIERKCWQETNSKVSANLWLTFSKNVEQTFLDSLILPFVKT